MTMEDRVNAKMRKLSAALAAPRPDYCNRPLAAHGLTSYRHACSYGWIMIGASDHADALRQARRSTDGPIGLHLLEIWDGAKYVPAGGPPT